MARNAHTKKEKIRARQLVERQSERRKGNVYRFEITFNITDTEQVHIADRLSTLPRGGATRFIRDAIAEKMAYQRLGVESSPSQQFELMIQMVADRDNLIEQLFSKLDRMERQLEELQSRPFTVAQTIIPQKQEPIVQSSGIDMSRDRPRAKLKPGKAVEAEPAEEWTDEMMRQKGYEMAMSIKNAVPGRRT